MKLLKGIFFTWLIMFMGTAAWAEDKNWVGTYSNSWSVPENWDAGTVPVAYDNVNIAQGTSPVVYDYNGTPWFSLLQIDNNAALQLGDGYELRAYLLQVGAVGLGEFNQLGGALRPQSLTLGEQETGEGIYNLTGGVLYMAGQEEYIGKSGQGVFNQFGGANYVQPLANTTRSNLYVGADSTAVGEYNLYAGVLQARDEYIGDYGQGTINQTGGTNSSRYTMVLGRYGSGVGIYNLSGGELNTDDLVIGDEGKGTFNQTGGMHNNAVYYGSLIIGASPTGVGEYNLADGSLKSTVEHIGENGQGTFNQTGGEHITNSLLLGYPAAGVGTYNLSAGEFNAGSEIIGGEGLGIFNQTGGTNNLSMGLYLYNGTYNLSAGVLNSVSFEERIGGYGQSIFNQTGGIHNSALLILGDGPGSVYNLSAGKLNAGSIDIGYGDQTTFNQSGGDNTATTIVVEGFGRGHYSFSGGTLTAGQVERDTAGNEVGFTPGLIINEGSFQIHDGGTAMQPLVVRGNVDNNGEFMVTNAHVRFDGVFNNNGAFHSDPSVMSFNDLTIGASGYLSGSVGDQFQISGNFINSSQMNTLWFTGNSQLVFDSGIHMFQPNGVDKGAMAAGFEDNFAWGDVSFGNGQITLTSLSANQISALYAGTVSGLIIVGNTVENLFGDVNVYYMPDANAWLGGQTYAFASGKGELIPINTVVTPEPAAMLLYGLGGFPLAARFLRRRKRVRV